MDIDLKLLPGQPHLKRILGSHIELLILQQEQGFYDLLLML